ncbi:hypothetical protein M9H77_35610 [Catharanthus roseus]|uniref:Uncharacterized protein n=1 Tax=Catharanthus roseus TaxID=4058 RepID=A0ACB9ZQ98_CATRO|nr:hypothetical protein M9H77_35610 [Catharanthus roseus]
MAPTPSSKVNQLFSTPSSKSNQSHLSRTPQSKNRLNFNVPKPSPNPHSAAAAAAAKENNPPAEHPVEVIGRIRDYPDQKNKPISSSALQLNPESQSLRVKTEIGYRDFSLDGISLSEKEDLEGFYKKFIESRINGVKLGAKCTIMMYGPTGSGKSHTMFGCAKQPGIVYRSLKDILGEEEDISVLVTVLEIYNEEIYDLLSTNSNGGFSLGWPKGGSSSKVKLEVMGKKAKNATFIAGHEATKISKEIEKVEKRRIVKSTLCNERSSRSHCMIILDVPKVGGQLMLVDMAGSENIEQAGQNGFEAKMQTAKINQGNIALKRVVESIANGDSHVPFRDSKLTMLLQDSFEDSQSKILMILCASPDPKELHKTISTLEYGAKAKCIVRGPQTPVKEKATEDSSAVILGSRIAAMDQFISKLQTEKKLREKERNQAHEELQKKEKEISELRAKLAVVEGKGGETSEEKINLKVNELTQELKCKLENKILECQKIADKFLEKERKMEERTFQQQQELEMLRQRLEEIESQLCHTRVGGGSVDMEGNSFMRKLLESCSEDSGMVKSMDLDRSFDFDAGKREVMVYKTGISNDQTILGFENRKNSKCEEDYDVLIIPNFSKKSGLSTVFEEEEEEEDSGDDREKFSDEEVQKEVIEEKKVCSSSAPMVDISNNRSDFHQGLFTESPVIFSAFPVLSSDNEDKVESFGDDLALEKLVQSQPRGELETAEDAATSRRKRIQNIFTLCGNYRELSQRPENIDPLSILMPENEQKLTEKVTNIIKSSVEKFIDDSKENDYPSQEKAGDLNVYVKWEAAQENPGKFITKLKVMKNSTLADLRKLIEIHLGADNQAFTFLVLGDPSGAPVPREKEASTLTTKLPICNNQLGGHLACLRPLKGIQQIFHLPFSPIENKLPVTPTPTAIKHDCYTSPDLPEHLNSTPFITLRRH